MEQRLTPAVFSGSAISALVGLLMGVLLHLPWEKHPGGPQILLSAAEAAQPARPAPDEAVEAPAPEPIQTADLDTGYAPPTPLPVTRLHPEMFDVQPAAAEDAERQDVDGLATADEAPPP